MADEIGRIALRHDQDVFAARRVGRLVGELVGLESQDQIRLATALSEIGRELVGKRTQGTVAFVIDDDRLVTTVRYSAETDLRGSDGIRLAGRLVDEIVLAPEGGLIRMVKRLPHGRAARPLREIRARLVELAPTGVLDEFREQNRELAGTLEEVLRLNTELQETNQGVLALYNQLSAELEETNRGVVALYAELDEKSNQLRDAGEARKRFWATVSHELRTPLNSIIGLVRLLVGPGGDPLTPEQTYQMRLIGGSAETLLALVGELLDMAKAESGRMDPQPTVVDLLSLAERLRMTLRPTAGQRVEIAVDVADSARHMFADETMLTRILRNLLSNALKFTEEGEVRLSARLNEVKDEITVTVTDTGIGIREADWERVFEEFYQVPGAIQIRSKGTGLGLPYARSLAEALGGTLTLTSVYGEGTSVTLRVPDHLGTPEVDRVLVVDDDAEFRESARRMLLGFAHRVDAAADGVQALETMAGHVPDVLLVDLLMPRLDGTGLLQRMGEDPRLSDIPVIVTLLPGQAPPARPSIVKHGLRRDQLLDAIRAVRATAVKDV